MLLLLYEHRNLTWFANLRQGDKSRLAGPALNSVHKKSWGLVSEGIVRDRHKLATNMPDVALGLPSH